MIKIFRFVAFLEGISYILLLFIAVPIKYLLNDPTYVKLLGMPHGILFIGYIILSVIGKNNFKWSYLEFFIVTAASLIPLSLIHI